MSWSLRGILQVYSPICAYLYTFIYRERQIEIHGYSADVRMVSASFTMQCDLQTRCDYHFSGLSVLGCVCGLREVETAEDGYLSLFWL